MAEVKTDFASGEELEASALNSINAEINKNGGLKDDIDGGETISGATTPQASFIKEADGELYACDANDTARLRFDGFVISDTTDGNPADFRGSGIVAGFTGLTPGAKYYVQDDKSIGTTVGTYEILVGIAISATELLIMHGSDEYIGTESYSNGYGGGVAGDPSDTVTMPANAKTCIIECAIETNSKIVRTQFILKRKGESSVSVKIAMTAASVDSPITATLSGNTITITVTGLSTISSRSISGTVYYYT